MRQNTLPKRNLKITAHDFLIRQSTGDARKLYNLVELCFQQGQSGVPIDEEFAQNVLSNAQIRYDKGGDEHYNVISAFIKSIRGSDPQAAVYYLARMIEGGEDVKFIARRLIISAAEDIGLANPNALMLSNETFSAVERVGWPESRIILSQCTIYLATSPKSNSAYTAIGKAQKLVQQTGNLEVPAHLKNASSALARDLGHGKGYLYPHDHSGGFVAQEYLPKDIQGSVFWSPAANPKEQQISAQQKAMWKGKYEGINAVEPAVRLFKALPLQYRWWLQVDPSLRLGLLIYLILFRYQSTILGQHRTVFTELLL